MSDLHSARGAVTFLRQEGYRYEAQIIEDLAAEVKRLTDGISDERAAVVAWLRGQAESTNFRPMGCPLADAIERGEHRREEER